jgi:NAD(P)-dependent dehydrogenase (short-subunit alcohol dehydrogenase family)
MPNVLITGANRGIGLEFTRQYAAAGWRVFATCRHPAEAGVLQDIARRGNVTVHRLDVTRVEDCHDIAWELRGTPLDILLNNAGIYLEWRYHGPELGAIRYDDWLRTMEVNTFGAVRLTETLFPNIRDSERRMIVTITSHMGSIADIHTPGSYYYRSSKAALNAAMQGLAEALKPHHITVLLLHPGGVKTRMGPSDGIAPEASVRGMRNIIDSIDLADTGRFLRFDGTPMPW